MENNLFALAVQESSVTLASDPIIDCALSQAKSLEASGDLLAKLTLYEQRLNRTLEKAKAELKQLQQERAAAREKALEDAAKILNLKEALEEPWEPESDGFEFSTEDLTRWVDRRDLIQQARHFDFCGKLPATEEEFDPETSDV